MAPINVLIFEPYPFSNEGGNALTQLYIAKFINKEKFNIILVSPFESDFTSKLKRQGIECIVMPPPSRMGRYGGKCLKDNLAGRFLTALSLIPYNMKLSRIMEEKKIDLVYCNCIRAVLSVALAAKLSKRPIFWYVKGELRNRTLDTIGFVIVDKICFFCERNKNDKYPQLVKMFKYKIDILKIGIDSANIIEVERKDKTEIAKELSISDDRVNLIVSGQLYPPKGVHYLLEAVAILVSEFPKIRLYIMGHCIIDEYKGYYDHLMNIIKNKNLEDKVTFTGWRKDALEVVSLMDVLIHPSLTEGFGRAVLEAMALGKPVIASKVGGLREIIKDGENGFLVEPGNVMQLSEKLSILLSDKQLRNRFGKAAKETVFIEYLIEDKIDRLEKIWSKMACRKAIK